tara:strand:+ start:400 stop:1380 length:981 start_codon:yes stop_codon:yes gene_type:complete
MERYFSKNSDGTVEFTPIEEDHARIIYDQIRKQFSYLSERCSVEKKFLAKIPKENDVLIKVFTKKLIIYKVELRKTEDEFKSVKRWYDNNKLPYPGSPKDRLLEKKRRKRLEDYYKSLKKTGTNENIFRFNGDFWTVRYKGKEKFIKHTKGMDYIAYLFRHQKQEIHSMKLYQAFTEEIPDTNRRMSKMSSKKIEKYEGLYKDVKDDYKMLTPEALENLKGRLDELKIDQNKAMMENNSLEEERISKEVEELDNFIKANTYKWGEVRVFSTSTEKMRISINKAIKTAKNNIEKVHKELFSHIDKYLETGTYNYYRPEIPIIWVQDN